MDEEMRMQYNRGYIAGALSNPEYFKGSIYISNEELAMQYQRGYIDGLKEGRATFEPKTAHREYNDIYDHYLCGNCKTVVMDYDNFCPNCGYRMVDPWERSENDRIGNICKKHN